MNLKWMILLFVIFILLSLPTVITRDLILALLLTLLYVSLAENYDILGGYLGYINMGQGAYFGLSSYVTVILLNSSLFHAMGYMALPAAMILGTSVAPLFAAGMSFPLFRLKGAYFAMATWAQVALLQLLVLNFDTITGGAWGIYVPSAYFIDIAYTYYLAVAVAFVSVWMNYRISKGRMGIALKSIRESEEAASVIGLNLFKFKRRALILGSIPSGFAGGVFALSMGYIDVSSALGVGKTLLPVVMAMLGGSGLVLGPVVGAFIMRIIDVYLINYAALPVPSLAIYGVALVLIGLLMPEGVLNFAKERRKMGLRQITFVKTLKKHKPKGQDMPS